jgi:hypothetical protein
MAGTTAPGITVPGVANVSHARVSTVAASAPESPAWEQDAEPAIYANGSTTTTRQMRWTRPTEVDSISLFGLPAVSLRVLFISALVLALAAGGWYLSRYFGGFSQPARESVAVRWHYWLRWVNEATLQDELKTRGAECWELASAQRFEDGHYELIFKRPSWTSSAIETAPPSETEAQMASPQEPESPKLKADLRRFETDFDPSKSTKAPTGS